MSATIFQSMSDPGVAAAFQAGQIGVIPSDTQYGLMCDALQPEAVERVYKVRQRTPDKPCVVLAASVEQILDIDGPDTNTVLMAEKFWPGAISVVVANKKSTLQHIHRGGGSIVWRIPAVAELRALLEQTGPLLAPSANPEGQPPAATIAEAQAYFGDAVDFYVDGGARADQPPSTIIRFTEDGLIEVLRQGVVQISESGEVLAQ